MRRAARLRARCSRCSALRARRARGRSRRHLVRARSTTRTRETNKPDALALGRPRLELREEGRSARVDRVPDRRSSTTRAGRFEATRGGRAARVLGTWEPSRGAARRHPGRPRGQLARLEDEDAARRGRRHGVDVGRRRRRASPRSVITYSETWSIEGLPDAPVFARDDSMGSATTESMEGRTGYKTETVARTATRSKGRFERDGTRTGRFRMIRSGAGRRRREPHAGRAPAQGDVPALDGARRATPTSRRSSPDSSRSRAAAADRRSARRRTPRSANPSRAWCARSGERSGRRVGPDRPHDGGRSRRQFCVGQDPRAGAGTLWRPANSASERARPRRGPRRRRTRSRGSGASCSGCTPRSIRSTRPRPGGDEALGARSPARARRRGRGAVGRRGRRRRRRLLPRARRARAARSRESRRVRDRRARSSRRPRAAAGSDARSSTPRSPGRARAAPRASRCASPRATPTGRRSGAALGFGDFVDVLDRRL